ncbi:MAG TPA: 4Fe-4S binding protein [bacterium]|nr:4Fe-4S binding protein [bacterium]
MINKPLLGEAGLTGSWSIYQPVIKKELCNAVKKGKEICQLCWLYCPDAVIKKGIPPQINYDYCKGCGICATECPANAIIMEKK